MEDIKTSPLPTPAASTAGLAQLVLRPIPEVPQAPTAEEEIAYIDDIDDDFPSVDGPSQMSTSQCSTVLSVDSGRASSQSTLKSPEKGTGLRRSRKMVVCRITLLDGTTFEPQGIDKNATGQVIFDKVTQNLDLIETDYFGLTYRDNKGKKFWIDNTKKVAKQVKGGTWVFEFQVKFYPPDPHSLKEDLTRYQLCLQVRVDIFNGRLPCSFLTYALLGSFTVQAELGDYEAREYSGSIDYLKDFDFAPSQQAELLEKIAELHKGHKGQTPEEAESRFLENAKKLAMYGVDLHDVKDVENKPLVLGVCASGILVYKDRLRINRFVWPKILKLSYKRNIFYVQIRPGPQDPHEKTVGFKLDNHKLAKRLWKICVEHHAFFRLKDAEAQNQATLFPRFNTKFRYSGRTQAQAKKAAEAQHREEPHIARTAERRSLVKDKEKAKSMDDMAHRKNELDKDGHPDERDMYDKKKGDPLATTGFGPYPDHNNLEDGKQRRGPGDESEDRRDKQQGDGDKTEGMPGYQGDTSGLTEGGMLGPKSKKDKEEEKKRKKEEEKRKKEEEKERKRLEKLEKDKDKKKTTEDRTDKKKDPNAAETAINGHPDSAELEKGKDRHAGKGGKDGKDGTQYETDIDAILAGKHGDARDQDEAGKDRRKGGKDDKDRDRYGRGDRDADRYGKDRDRYGKDDDRYRDRDRDKERDRHGKEGDRYRDRDHDKDRDRHGKEGDRYRDRDHDKDRDRHGKAGDKDRDKDRDKHDKDRDKHGKDADKHGKDQDKEGKDDKEGGKHGKKDDKHGKKGDKGDSFKGDKDKKGGLFGRFGKKSPSKKDKDYDPSKISGEDDFPPPLPPQEGEMDRLRQKKKAGMTWALPGMEELKERQAAGNQGLAKTGLLVAEESSESPVSYISTAQIGLKAPELHGSDSFPDIEKQHNLGDIQNEDKQAGLAPGDYGMYPGDDKSIDRKMQFIPVVPPSVETRESNKGGFGVRMPFFEPAGESSTDDSSLGRRGPPPVAKKPKAPGGYDSEEDRLLRRSGEPPTVQTESFKYTPNLDELPMSTSNIPIVETKTHTVTYEKDGVPFETEDSILISAHSVTTKSQTIDTTTYKTERDGMIETRVERKITVTSDENDDIDHEKLLRDAIEEVTKMNPDLSVERIECIKQIEGEK